MRTVYSWNSANIEHIAKHGVTPAETEYVVDYAGRGYPKRAGDGKWLVWGKTEAGRHLQVIFIRPKPDEVEPDSLRLPDLMDFSAGMAEVIYVIHAMDLPPRDRRNFRKRR